MDTSHASCSQCDSVDATRICVDCGNLSYCVECFTKKHSGTSSKFHTVRDYKSKAIISANSDRSYQSISQINKFDLIPDDICSPSSLYIDNSEEPSPVSPKINTSHTELEVFPIYSKNIDDTILCPARTSFPQTMPSTLIEEQCHIFESGKIKEFKSIEEIADALNIGESLTEFRVPIVTFIGIPVKEESMANIVLLTNNTIKFVEGTNRTLSPLCTMIYDSVNGLLVLETQNMHKQAEKYIEEQTVLLNILLALSDVIIFSETKIRTDYIRIHEMMKNCNTRFGAFFSKIDKVNPKRLAPGLIYLQLRKFEITDNLSTVIQNETGRKNLFNNYSDIIFVDIVERNDFENFHNGLRKMLNEISGVRNLHSLKEILDCINNCKESASCGQDIMASNDIPNSWFLCNIVCQICQKKCMKSFDHRDAHTNDCDCLPDNQNEVYFCKFCMTENSNNKGMTPLVLRPMSREESFLKNIVSYPFRLGLVECNVHGIIHNNSWFATSNTLEDIHIEYYHKWPGEKFMSEHVYPMGQIIIDKVNEISDPVVRVLTKSTEYVSDNVQPIDWQPTRGASNCSCCREPFTIKMAKHHCRICKFVICSNCCHPNHSARVCKVCFDKNPEMSSEVDPTAITAFNVVRDYGQTFSSFFRRKVSSYMRPDYWEDDEKAIHCFLCRKEFHREINPIHHCRACGKCICDKCSQNQRPVEWRCLSVPSRICDKCIENQYWKKPLG